MKVIEILNLNRELLIFFQKAGIRLDDVQYIDLFKEYRTLSAQGEKVSYIVARLATEYAISERNENGTAVVPPVDAHLAILLHIAFTLHEELQLVL